VRKLPTRVEPAPLVQLRPDAVKNETPPPRTPDPSPPPPVVQPLAPERYKVAFTASKELRDKLERLQELTGEDLAAVIEAAVTEKLERVEAKRYAEVKKPRKSLDETEISPKTRYIPAAVRRAVRKRDGDRCRFADKNGRRCTERRSLEFHHHDPFGRGGAHDPDQISLRCRTHNLYAAERDYGKDVMDQFRRGCVSESAPAHGTVYLASNYIVS
jgi:hypothetical protein